MTFSSIIKLYEEMDFANLAPSRPLLSNGCNNGSKLAS